MGRTLQKKKSRSSIPRATLKAKSLKRPIKASPLVAAHWDKHLTLSQNYRKLGLTSKLNARSGGTEVKAKTLDDKERGQKRDPLAIAGVKADLGRALKSAKVLRDAEGRIVEVVREGGDTNPLNDPLVALDGESEDEEGMRNNHDRDQGVVPALERAAAVELEGVQKRKRPRKQSEREMEWIEALVDRYGDDVRAMARDRRLNPRQQTEADISRRVESWRQNKTSGNEG